MEKYTSFIKLAPIVLLTVLLSCSQPSENRKTTQNEPGIEAEGEYTAPIMVVEIKENSVRIGEQEWMIQNLATERFRNGDPIHAAITSFEWETAGDQRLASWGYYNNEPSYNGVYGKIYNWFAVNDQRGLCPDGWRVPTDDDWQSLIDLAGGNEQAAIYLKSEMNWEANGSGNNQSGFSALPGGFKGYDGTSYQVGYFGARWSSTEISESFAWARNMVFDSDAVGRANGYKMDGFSVRCIKE